MLIKGWFLKEIYLVSCMLNIASKRCVYAYVFHMSMMFGIVSGQSKNKLNVKYPLELSIKKRVFTYILYPAKPDCIRLLIIVIKCL